MSGGAILHTSRSRTSWKAKYIFLEMYKLVAIKAKHYKSKYEMKSINSTDRFLWKRKIIIEKAWSFVYTYTK